MNPQPACESVPISEKGDDGVTVESSLRVPQHLSIAFSTAADAYCSAAYAVAPHSLPTKVQVIMMRFDTWKRLRVYILWHFRAS